MNLVLAALIVTAWSTIYVVISENPPIGVDPHRWRTGCLCVLQAFPLLVLIALYFAYSR